MGSNLSTTSVEISCDLQPDNAIVNFPIQSSSTEVDAFLEKVVVDSLNAACSARDKVIAIAFPQWAKILAKIIRMIGEYEDKEDEMKQLFDQVQLQRFYIEYYKNPKEINLKLETIIVSIV